ncbi:hypothetical protein ACOMHN_038102 [Nucella lapillus]
MSTPITSKFLPANKENTPLQKDSKNEEKQERGTVLQQESERSRASIKRKLTQEESFEEDSSISKRTKGDRQSPQNRDSNNDSTLSDQSDCILEHEDDSAQNTCISNTQDAWERRVEEAFGDYHPPYSLSNDAPNGDNVRHKRKDSLRAPSMMKQQSENNAAGYGGNHMNRNQESRRKPELLQDDGAGTDIYRNYGINTNKLWKQSTVGAIKCQRQCGLRNSKGGK